MIYNMDCITGAREHIPNKSIDLGIFDPPFGIEETKFEQLYNRNGKDVIKGYVEAPTNYYEWSKEWITEAVRCLKDDGSIYIVSGWSNSDIIGRIIREMDLFLINKIIWHFNFGVYTTRKYHTSHYEIFYIKKKKSVRHTFNTHCRFGPEETDTKKHKRCYDDMSSVWRIQKEQSPKTVKNLNKLPNELVDKMIQYSSNEGDMVGDFFLGNFTTYNSAKKLKRECCGFEINKNSYEQFYNPCPYPNCGIPNAETIKTIEDAQKGIGLHKVDSIEQLFKELESDDE